MARAMSNVQAFTLPEHVRIYRTNEGADVPDKYGWQHINSTGVVLTENSTSYNTGEDALNDVDSGHGQTPAAVYYDYPTAAPDA